MEAFVFFLQSLQIDLIFQYIVVILSISFLVAFMSSIFVNRKKVNLYSLVIKDDGKASKIGVSFIFVLFLIVYQVFVGKEISVQLVELLGIIFTAEIGTKYIEKKSLSDQDVKNIKEKALMQMEDPMLKKAPVSSAKATMDVDFSSI